LIVSKRVGAQAALIVHGSCGYGQFLATVGQDIWHIVSDESHVDDNFSHKELPKEPGFYVWEGDVVYSRYETMDGTEFDCELDGKFRPATIEDFTLFGFPLPPMPGDGERTALSAAIEGERSQLEVLRLEHDLLRAALELLLHQAEDLQKAAGDTWPPPFMESSLEVARNALGQDKADPLSLLEPPPLPPRKPERIDPDVARQMAEDMGAPSLGEEGD
jgi:hypothetical protein